MLSFQLAILLSVFQAITDNSDGEATPTPARHASNAPGRNFRQDLFKVPVTANCGSPP